MTSIVMRTQKGRELLLARAIRSVVAQTLPRVELVVVEDGSNQAAALVDELTEASTVSATHIAIEQGGRARAGNVGLEKCAGDFIGFLDDDDEYFPDHLEVLTRALVAFPSVPAACAGTVETAYDIASTAPLCLRDVGKKVHTCKPFSLERLWRANFIPIQSVLFRRETWLACGGFDESLDYLEDWDLWLRFAVLGDFAAVDAVTSRFRMPAARSLLLARRRFHEACITAVRENQAEIARTLPPERRFPNLEHIVTGRFDRRQRLKNRLRGYLGLNRLRRFGGWPASAIRRN